jgi:CPA1 family monovalent cation:H+ antiporter
MTSVLVPVLAAVGGDQSAVARLVTVLIILLLVATAVALLSRRFRIPYVTGLVVAGLAISEFIPQGTIGLNSSLIFNLFLPILLFEAAINTDISRLRSTVKPIALLALPGVVIASGVTAIVLKLGLGIVWIPALLLGVILAITDTVSVIAVFKEVSVPARLITIVEGESLFNDGMALVLFSLILKAYTAGSVTVAESLKELFVVILGGGLVGLVLGYLGVVLYVQIEDSLSNILLTVAIALGAFQLSQVIGVSGVVAVVIAGLVVGNVELVSVSATSRLTILSFWEYAGFSVNTFIFLLIGLEIKLETLGRILPAVLLAILAYQIGRFLAVYPLLALVRWIDRPIPIRWQHVLFLGNIKGSLSMALALSLPAGLTGRSELIAIVFGAVLLSLVVQGVSLPWMVRRLQLGQKSEAQQWIESLQSQLISAKAAQDELESLLKTGVLSKSIYEELRASYQVKVAAAERSLRDLYNRRTDPLTLAAGNFSRLDAIRRRLLTAEKDALNDALRKRILSEEIVRSRVGTIDQELLNLDDD